MRGNPQVLIRVGDVGRIFVQHFEGRAKLRDSKLKFQIYNKNGCFINYWPLGGLIINVAVSYTHLDVYKRQPVYGLFYSLLKGIFGGGIKESPWRSKCF